MAPEPHANYLASFHVLSDSYSVLIPFCYPFIDVFLCKNVSQGFLFFPVVLENEHFSQKLGYATML